MHWQRWRKTGDPLVVRKPAANSGSFKKGQTAHNKGKLGPPSPKKGIPLSPEVKEKISLALKGHLPPNKGVPHTEETKVKIRAARAKQTITDEHKQAIRQGNLGKPKSPEHIAKLSGSNHYRWKGGTKRNLSKKEWREVRLQVLERDGWCCCQCGNSNPKSLIIHHIIHFDEGGQDTVENLITWCRSCHARYHNTKAVNT